MADSALVISALDFCQRILVEHQTRRAENQAAVVVPVVFDGFEAIAGIVAATARASSGEVIVARTYEDGCDAGLDIETELPELAAAIRELDPWLPGDLGLEIDGTFCRLVGPFGAGYSDAQSAIRGFVAALFHPDLRKADLAFLIWDAGPLEELIAQRVWALITELPRLLSLPVGRSLVVGIGDGRLDVPLHCTGETSVRFHIRDRDVLVRRPWLSCLQEASRVSRMARTDVPVIVIFTGAGASRHFGLPLGNDLRDQALGHLLDASWSGKPPDQMARQFFEELKNSHERLLPGEREAGEDAFVDALTLERVLREEQHREMQRNSNTLRAFATMHDGQMDVLRARLALDPSPSPLAALLSTGRKIAVVTVNFDHGLEVELGDGVHPFVTEVELDGFRDYLNAYLANVETAVPYVKLHGDIGAPHTIVANVDDAAAGLSAARISAIRALRDIDAQIRPWVYVGYSMRDADVNMILGSPEFADRTVEWWVNPFIDPAIARFIANYRLARWPPAYSVVERVITLTANDYFTYLSRDIRSNSP